MRKKINNLIHKKLIIITIVTQLLIAFGGTAMSVVANAEENNHQFYEYMETLKHLEEHLEQHSRSYSEINRAVARINIRGKMRESDYYNNLIIE
ncbi:MAG: hypothetical protein ACRDD2_13400 [Sarcina sp.]